MCAGHAAFSFYSALYHRYLYIFIFIYKEPRLSLFRHTASLQKCSRSIFAFYVRVPASLHANTPIQMPRRYRSFLKHCHKNIWYIKFHAISHDILMSISPSFDICIWLRITRSLMRACLFAIRIILLDWGLIEYCHMQASRNISVIRARKQLYTIHAPVYIYCFYRSWHKKHEQQSQSYRHHHHRELKYRIFT